MKKAIWIALLLVPVVVLPVSVNEEEINTVEPVEFEDYEGPVTVINTHDEITGIGRSLKEGLTGESFTWAGKYTMVHAVDPGAEKMNADIFIIEAAAGVDTIYNVRRILAGYLEDAYGYSYEQAFLVAKFVTYYNAVYRSNMKYFGEKYSEKVMSYLSSNTVGIAISYKNWVGQTQMVIPLRKGDSRLDTSNLTGNDVISNLQSNEEDRGVGDRKDMMDLRKGELGEDRDELEAKKEEARLKEIDMELAEAELARQKSQVDNIDEQKIMELAKQEEEMKAEKEKLAALQKEIQEEEMRIQTEENELANEEARIAKDEYINDMQNDPEKAYEDLQAAQNELRKEQESIMGGKLYYLKVKEWERYGHYNNDMVIIDPATRKVLARSPVSRIDCNKYLLNENGVVVIIHNDDQSSEHNLVLLDKNDLTLVKTGLANVFWRSFIEDRDGFIYVVVNKGDSFYLGRFTYDLELETLSPVKMDKDSFISFFEDTIYINRVDKSIVVLNKKDLTLLDEINP